MVSRTNGFFVRDWSLGLGWNNMRYILEAAVLQASLLNRTLIIPSFIYARACEYPIEVCAEYAPMVNKGDAVGWEEWRSLPTEQQMGWRIPISLMVNITQIREKHPVILISDWLRMHGRSPDEERSNGMWHRDFYHASASVFEEDETKTPSLFVVENRWYDPQNVIRVDRIPDDMKERGYWEPEGGNEDAGERGHWPVQPETKVSEHLDAIAGDNAFMDFDSAKQALQEGITGVVWDLSSDEKIINLLRDNGWEVLYTYKAPWGDYTKTVVEPLLQVVRRSAIRGWVDEYAREKADVLLLAGETHLYRKPGAMRFTTRERSYDFQDTVLNYIVSVAAYDVLAFRLAQRMRARVDGRLWMGAHMRRGDFVRNGWAMEKDPKIHVERVKDRLASGRQVLESLKQKRLVPYDIPGMRVSREFVERDAPWSTDPFYIATDERDPEALRIIAEHGAVFLKDLLTMDDLREFGWPLLLTDCRAVVEQHLLARSAYFYAHILSSVAGGIVNLRAAAGADARTALVD
ncbi:hypothetical protein K488DRAFT_52672 [Vararia minispora EC-137]|uniref:Uncharacterized protein n=1 Tax=Vararia minispora EC-137 TaxID=1314806 RepID=A0ACB8QHK0_9AGAM|nr:hypothetical protein K488DRAFT_52672 [Vararia minispora EC-137]